MEALREPGLQPVLFITLGLAGEGGPLRLWTGANTRRGGPDDDPEDLQLYPGRKLVNFPEMAQLADAKAHRIELVLVATAETRALLGERKGEVRGAPVTISYGVLKNSAPHPDIAWPVWRARYVADQVGFRFENGLPVVVVSAGSATVRRKRPANAFWTDPSQKRAHPGDRVCDRIADLNEGVTRNFKGG